MAVSIGFTATEAGVFPSDWPIRPLGDLFEFSGGHSASRAQLSDVGYCYLHYGDIHGARKSSIDTRADFLAIPKLPIALRDVSSRSMLDDGDVVFVDASEDDEGASKHIVVINKDRIPFIAGLHTIVAKSKSDVLAPEYRRYCFQTSSIRSQFLFYAVGTKVTGISKSNIPKLLLPVPPLPEQRAIAAALSDVDSLLESLDRLIAKKRDLKQATMQQLLTGKTRLPGFSGEWETVRLGDVAEMSSGGTPLSSVADYYGGEIPWVSISDMTKAGKFLRHTEETLTRRGLTNCAAKMFQPGTVLYAMYASLGECSIASVPLCTSQAILGIRPAARLGAEFLYYLLSSMKAAVREVGQQGTQANLNKGMVQDFSLNLPSSAEQEAIASVLADIDTEIGALTARFDKVRDLKRAMMQELLTGKTRLVSGEAAHA